MAKIWEEQGTFRVTEQRLADQVRTIMKFGWMTDAQIEELRRQYVNSQCKDSATVDIVPASDEVEKSSPAQTDPPYVNNIQVNVESDSTDPWETEVAKSIQEIIETCEKRERIPSLRGYSKYKLFDVVGKVDKVLGNINTENITQTNNLLYAAATYVVKTLGKDACNKKPITMPMWKLRLESKLNQMRRDLARIESMKAGLLKKEKLKSVLEAKHRIKENGYAVVTEQLRQRIQATASKIRRYEERITQFRQNKKFRSNQGAFFREINGNHRNQESSPADTETSLNFWRGIWENNKTHRNDAGWLDNVKQSIAHPKQADVTITLQKLRRLLSKTPNWKAPGPDQVQRFWIKNFKSLHARLAQQMENCLIKGDVPDWMTEGRTYLIMKDSSKGNIPSNYRPITCLPLMWKLMTGVLAEEIYCYMHDQNLLTDEQKGCKKNCMGTKDLLHIDKIILKESKTKKKNLATSWIDYKKAFDMVPHSWLIECLNMFGVAKNAVKFLQTTMVNWRTQLVSGSSVLGQVRIKQGIFQGDSLSPLLFVISLIPMTLVLRKAKAGYVTRQGIKLTI